MTLPTAEMIDMASALRRVVPIAAKGRPETVEIGNARRLIDQFDNDAKNMCAQSLVSSIDALRFGKWADMKNAYASVHGASAVVDCHSAVMQAHAARGGVDLELVDKLTKHLQQFRDLPEARHAQAWGAYSQANKVLEGVEAYRSTVSDPTPAPASAIGPESTPVYAEPEREELAVGMRP